MQQGQVDVHAVHAGVCAPVTFAPCVSEGLKAFFLDLCDPFCLDVLALPIHMRTCSYRAGFAIVVIKHRQKIGRVATTLPCLKDFAMLILGWMAITVVIEPHLVCHREVQG